MLSQRFLMPGTGRNMLWVALGALSMIGIYGCSTEVKNDAQTDKKMREALSRPMKVSDLPQDVQKMIQGNKPQPTVVPQAP
jgi:uncharacterized lipoprotein